MVRLGEQARRRIDDVILDRGNLSSLMVFEKISFYQHISVFEGIPGITLSFLADISEEINLHEKNSHALTNRL